MAADYSQKTYQMKKEEASQQWHVIDAKGKILGRLAQEVAMLLMGKHKPTYTPHVDGGDFVIILNAGKLQVSGQKNKKKLYERYSGYPSGRKLENFDSLNQRRPGEPLRLAVKRMLPKNRLGRKMLTKLKLYTGEEHPHEAQNPNNYELKGRAALSETK